MKIPMRLYFDLCASTVLPLQSWHFCYDSCRFDHNLEPMRKRRPVEWGWGVCISFYIILYLIILVI